MPHLGENSFFWQMPKGLSEEEREYYKVNATEMCDIFGALFTDGVTAEHMLENDKHTDNDVIGSSLAVIPGDGLNIVVSIGSAMVNKHLYIATLPIQIPVTVGTNDVLLRCDTTTEKPFVTAIVRKRTSTELTDNVNRTANVHEVPIATVTIPTGSQTVSETMIVDQRLNTNLASDGKPFCGLMKPRPNADTKGIWEDWTRLQAEIINKWKTFEEKAKQEWEEQKQGFNQSFETLIKDFDNQILNNQKTFEEWFDNLQTYLDGDVAANLSGEITRLKMEKANKNDVYTKKETDEKLKEKAENSVVVSLTNKVDLTRTYTLTHNRTEATIIKGVTSDVGVGEKSPDNPYCITGVETNGVTLYSLPNGVCDEYNAKTGVLTKRVSKVVLNGSEVWHKWDIDKQIFTVDINKKGIRGKEISDKFTRWEGTSWANFPNLGFYVSEAGRSINFRNNQYVTIDEFKHFLSKNPVTVLYELATPETIQLTPKTTYQHTLSDLPTGQGIYQCQFMAQDDYAEGDTFTGYTAKPTGEETILPDKTFVKGDIVSVLVDTVNKKLGFKIGGSGVNQTLPPQIRSFAVTSGNAQNKLSWLLPVDTSAYEGLVIVRKIGSAPTKVSDGTKINLSKTATSYTDTGLTNDTKYYYRAFPYNSKKQYQTDIVGAVVSGTPKAIDPIFGNNSWEVIDSVSRSGNIPSTWQVGDTKDITLTTGETITMQIYGFKHDDLTSGGKAGITLGMKNLMSNTKQMNATATNVGGFTGSELYSWLQNDLYNSLPADLKYCIKSVYKKTSEGNTSAVISTNSMKLFLFSEIEVSDKILNSYYGEGNTYELFINGDINRIKKLDNGNGAENRWWLRSPSSSKEFPFCIIAQDGNFSRGRSTDELGVCFGFCI